MSLMNEENHPPLKRRHLGALKRVLGVVGCASQKSFTRSGVDKSDSGTQESLEEGKPFHLTRNWRLWP